MPVVISYSRAVLYRSRARAYAARAHWPRLLSFTHLLIVGATVRHACAGRLGPPRMRAMVGLDRVTGAVLVCALHGHLTAYTEWQREQILTSNDPFLP